MLAEHGTVQITTTETLMMTVTIVMYHRGPYIKEKKRTYSKLP